MQPIRRILFAIKDPDAHRQPGIDKAVALARALGARLELFHAISTPVFVDLQPLTGTTLGEIRREALALRKRRLEQLAARAHQPDLAITCSVVWDYPPHEAVVRHATHTGADLIVAECHKGRRLAPWLIHLTDWELLRTSPVPVLLLKSSRAWSERPVVMGAVDPSHAHAKPARLDARIAEEGERLADAFRGALHLMHANSPPAFGVTFLDPAVDSATLDALLDAQKRTRTREFEKFAKRHWVPRERRHVFDGDPVHAIPAGARKLGADVVVMGALARSGLSRVFIGNTAERVLNALPCDVLVVKPSRTRARVARKSRGMRVVPPQPILPLVA